MPPIVTSDLNFEIVGGLTKPTNPAENTIWVETNTEITSYSFSTSEPEDTSILWIKTAIKSDAYFNALKINELFVYPIGAFLYDGSSYNKITGEIYKNGIWQPLIEPLIVFDSGNTYNDITGGWGLNLIYNTDSATGTVTFTGSAIRCFVRSNTQYTAYRGIATTKTIDVTNYSKLCANFNYIGGHNNSYNIAYAALCSGTSFAATGTAPGYATQQTTITYDISNYTGAYNIGVASRTGPGLNLTLDFTKVWLE